MQIEITKQSEKDFRFLLSRLSHEIRNPVTLINSELQLMASSHPELCSYRQWDSLMDNLEYVKELLKELSDFSHAQTVTLVPVNPAEFLTTVLSCQKNTLDYLGIRLEIHVEHTSSPVFLDRIKMRQVIFNLIKNSCEAIFPLFTSMDTKASVCWITRNPPLFSQTFSCWISSKTVSRR